MIYYIFLFISSCVSVVVHETMQVSKVEADMKQAMWVLSMSYFDFFWLIKLWAKVLLREMRQPWKSDEWRGERNLGLESTGECSKCGLLWQGTSQHLWDNGAACLQCPGKFFMEPGCSFLIHKLNMEYLSVCAFTIFEDNQFLDKSVQSAGLASHNPVLEALLIFPQFNWQVHVDAVLQQPFSEGPAPTCRQTPWRLMLRRFSCEAMPRGSSWLVPIDITAYHTTGVLIICSDISLSGFVHAHFPQYIENISCIAETAMGILFLNRLVPWFQSRAAATHGLTLDILKGLVAAEKVRKQLCQLWANRNTSQAALSSRFVTVPQFRSTTCLANRRNKTILAAFAKIEAGKTSTLSMLTGAILPSAGKAFLGGFDVVKEQWKATAFLHEIRILRCPESVPWVFCSNSV